MRVHGKFEYLIFRAKLLHALKTRVKTIQCYGTWKHLSPGRRTLVYLRGSGISPRSALIRSWGRASLCTDSAQCGRQEVYGVENNVKEREIEAVVTVILDAVDRG